MGRQHRGMDRPDGRKVPEGSEEQRQMEETGCKIIYGVPTTFAFKEQMMMMMSRLVWQSQESSKGRRWKNAGYPCTVQQCKVHVQHFA